MRKQRLPKDFWTDIQLSDRNTYCLWHDGSKLKKCQVLTQKEARDFVKRAEEKNVGAFAMAFVESEGETQVFACSFSGIFAKYKWRDGIRLEISGANYKLLHDPEEKAKNDASMHCIEQWDIEKYGTKYNNAEYYVSWYNTNCHKFEDKKFDTLNEAESEFDKKQKADTPVRLVEYNKECHRVHEIKAACQHWHIEIGNYLEQIANKTLPLGEIPYVFSNSYLTSEIEVKNENGYLYFNVGWNQYSIQISRAFTCSKHSMYVLIDKVTPYNQLYYVVVDDNPIVAPWLARIERQW